MVARDPAKRNTLLPDRLDWTDKARTFVLLACLTLLIFIITCIGLLVQNKLLKEPVLSIKGAIPSMSSHFFADMLSMELPGFRAQNATEYTFSTNNVLSFLVQLLTDVNPHNPRSYIASILPSIREDTVPLKGNSGLAIAPIDYAPPPGSFRSDPKVDVPAPSGGDASEQEIDNDPPPPADSDNGPATAPSLSTGEKKVVFIYHSHNRESWVPELKSKGVKKLSDAFDPDTNITLVGKRLVSKLEDLGVGSKHSNTDYYSAVKGFDYQFSYKYSKKTVEAAFADNQELTYFFDIHRDSQRRELTTVEIDNKNYAQVYFIIGHRNPNWKKNEAFATKLHDALEKDYPGLSRGIWGKGSGNGEYNQSVSPNSVIIEIGGPENTLEESYRTAEVLAKAIADVYWEAERVNASG